MPLASLVYSLKPAILATLLASLLMERRVILVSSSFATLATAIHAAAALLRPFHWHNLFLPLLPAALIDALCSPTPYLVGLPSMLRDAVDWPALDESVLVDLDANSIEPAIGSEGSDSNLLPGWPQLVAALSTMQDNLRSPHEYRANGTIAAIVQEFLAATIGGYRDFIKSPAQQTPGKAPTAASRLSGGVSRLRAKLAETLNDTPAAAAAGKSPTAEGSGFMDEQVIQGPKGYRFNHSAFVQSFGSKASRDFAAALIHTQLWQVRPAATPALPQSAPWLPRCGHANENHRRGTSPALQTREVSATVQVFINERMTRMQQPYVSEDPFEVRVLQRQARSSSVSAAINRVKTSQKGIALAQWTSEKTSSMMAFGKSAAGAMSAGVEKVWQRIERSPGAPPLSCTQCLAAR